MKKNAFLRKVIILLSGAAAGQLLIIFSMPLITNIYSPEAFGEFSVFSSIVTILAIASAFRYDMSIPLIKDEEKRNNMIVLSFIIVTFITVLSLLIIMSLYLLDLIPMNFYIISIPLTTFLMGVYQLLTSISVVNQKIKEISITKFTQSLTQVIVQLSGGFFPGSSIMLLLGFLTGRITGIYKLVKVNFSNKSIGKYYKKDTIIKVAIEYKKFPLYSLPSSIINSLGVNLVPILLLLIYGPAIAGMYALGNKMIAAPMQLISKSFNNALFSEVPLLSHKKLKSLFWKSVKNLFLLGSVPVILVLLLEPLLFTKVFGEEWALAGDMLSILVFMFWIQFSIIPMSEILTILDKQEVKLIWDISRLIMVALIFGYSYIVKLEILQTISLYTILMTICYFILLILCRRAIKK